MSWIGARTEEGASMEVVLSLIKFPYRDDFFCFYKIRYGKKSPEILKKEKKQKCRNARTAALSPPSTAARKGIRSAIHAPLLSASTR
ncbi:MAG: hypothetical protein JZU67_03230, partial [Burkholderiaceae bacterium]|nr:hypothetical protein [Burkholderiaceae bacterium]